MFIMHVSLSSSHLFILTSYCRGSAITHIPRMRGPRLRGARPRAQGHASNSQFGYSPGPVTFLGRVWPGEAACRPQAPRTTRLQSWFSNSEFLSHRTVGRALHVSSALKDVPIVWDVLHFHICPHGRGHSGVSKNFSNTR